MTQSWRPKPALEQEERAGKLPHPVPCTGRAPAHPRCGPSSMGYIRAYESWDPWRLVDIACKPCLAHKQKLFNRKPSAPLNPWQTPPCLGSLLEKSALRTYTWPAICRHTTHKPQAAQPGQACPIVGYPCWHIAVRPRGLPCQALPVPTCFFPSAAAYLHPGCSEWRVQEPRASKYPSSRVSGCQPLKGLVLVLSMAEQLASLGMWPASSGSYLHAGTSMLATAAAALPLKQGRTQRRQLFVRSTMGGSPSRLIRSAELTCPDLLRPAKGRVLRCRNNPHSAI